MNRAILQFKGNKNKAMIFLLCVWATRYSQPCRPTLVSQVDGLDQSSYTISLSGSGHMLWESGSARIEHHMSHMPLEC